MAVQQNRKTRSKRDMRRSHDGISFANLSTDRATGEKHLRHNITARGFYKGKRVIKGKFEE